jgi:transmembrane sensor
MGQGATIREQAAAWAVRTGDPAFDEWEGFTAWLEADQAHARAYDAVMLAVVDAAKALPVAGNDDEAAGRGTRRWFGGAIAATLAVVAALGVWQFRGDTYAIETAPGEVQLVELDGIGEIEVAGGSRLVLDRSDPHLASLEHGQALFTLIHDEAAPFRLTVGEDTLVDIGTVFDVTHVPGRLSVAVSEGAVLFNPRRQNVRVDPGSRLISAGGRHRLEAVPLVQVGEWTEGRLTFNQATIAEVAEDLTRATGHGFAAARGASDTRISGSIVIEPLREDPRRAGPLLGVGIRYVDGSWEMGSR